MAPSFTTPPPAIFLHGCAVLTGGAILQGHGVLIEHGRIAAILPHNAAPAAQRHALPPECLLAPGFLDIQVNGGGGILFNDQPTAQAARHIADAHRRLGTTTILPTLITSDPDTMERAARAAAGFTTHGGLAGIHFEGPFLSPARPGVHLPALIRPPMDADLARHRSLAATFATQDDGAVLLTIAPECAPADTWHGLARAGIKLSAGHSTAAYEAVTPSVTGITHIFNAMPPPAARAPGLVTAALLSDRYAGVILDGHHVHPAMLRLMLATKTPDRIMLVSDAMSVAGTTQTEFTLQGRLILRRDGRLTTTDGTLAGADLCLAQAVRNAVSLLGLPIETAIAMASANPADFLGIGHRVGRIAPGLLAHLVLLGPGHDVLGTWRAGAWQEA
jgi:N-acetylglucosamine-6-phosphate deacetylase